MSLKVAERNPGNQLPHWQRRNLYRLDMTSEGRQVGSHHHVFRELPVCAQAASESLPGQVGLP